MSQLQLLKSRAFWPFFWTQFLGAFNDNLFKNALVILVAYKSLSVGGLGPQQVVPLSAGVFILPFFLFSASAGQLADKYPKTILIRWVKLVEIVIMIGAVIGFMLNSLPALLGVLFLMGLQSTFFGPVKYSILPDLLESKDLVGGNALVEMGTFVAILLGTIAGGLLIAAGTTGERVLWSALITVAGLGWLSSRAMGTIRANAPELQISLNPITPAWETFAATRKNRPVFLSVLGISWFWFFGASFLTLLPNYTKNVLRADELVVTLLLALFCVGISVGSLLCERLSGPQLELGLVPFGSLGMSLFALDLFLVGEPTIVSQGLMSPADVLGTFWGWRAGFDLAMLAVFGGFFTVPLYTMVQQRTEAAVRSRVIAGNNILNALFMVVSAMMLMGLTAVGCSIPQIFFVLAVLNALVALYIYTIIPEFLLRFVVWILGKVMYRIRVEGREHLPTEGPAVLVCNHQSFVDWLLIAGIVRAPVRFVMYHTFMSMPVVGFLFRDAKVIPIASARESEKTLQAAFDSIAQELEAGEVVCIFPEGSITHDGNLAHFRPGIEKIIKRTPVPVVPMAINGMWGSMFSRYGSRAARSKRRPYRNRLQLRVGTPVPAGEVTALALRQQVEELLGN